MKLDDPTKAGIGLAIVAIIIGVLVLSFAYIYVENKTALAYEKGEVWELQLGESEGFKGCSVGGTCSESLTELFYRNGGDIYYANYPQGTKKRMNVLFNTVDREFIK